MAANKMGGIASHNPHLPLSSGRAYPKITPTNAYKMKKITALATMMAIRQPKESDAVVGGRRNVIPPALALLKGG